MNNLSTRSLNHTWAYQTTTRRINPNYVDSLGVRFHREYNSFTNYHLDSKYTFYFLLLPNLPILLYSILTQVNIYYDLNGYLIKPGLFSLINALIMLISAIVFFRYISKHKTTWIMYKSCTLFYFTNLIWSMIWPIFVSYLIPKYLFVFAVVEKVIFILILLYSSSDLRRAFVLLVNTQQIWSDSFKFKYNPVTYYSLFPHNRDLKRPSFSFTNSRLFKMILTLSTVIVGVMLVIGGNLLGSFLSSLFKGENLNQQGIQKQLQDKDMYPVNKYSLIILIVLIGPVFEEMIYRYCLMNLGNKERYSILTSALIFALAHTAQSGILKLFPYLFSGLVFSGVYYLSGNVWLSSLVHIANNSIAFLFI